MTKDEKMYACYLNGSIYGKGPLDYMLELFKDYFITCEMYGKKEGTFKVVSYEKGEMIKPNEDSTVRTEVKKSYDKMVEKHNGALERLDD